MLSKANLRRSGRTVRRVENGWCLCYRNDITHEGLCGNKTTGVSGRRGKGLEGWTLRPVANRCLNRKFWDSYY